MAPQIPILPLKTILLAHLLLFSLAMYVSPLSPSWFWTNLGILILLLRLLEAPAVPGATDAAPQIAEILVYLYTFTVINDIICFSISPDGLSPGQTFSLTMACFSMIMKPFVGPFSLPMSIASGGLTPPMSIACCLCSHRFCAMRVRRAATHAPPPLACCAPQYRRYCST
jgi:hypothetical protein